MKHTRTAAALKTISANAYRASDAINAVQRECAKRGIKGRRFAATLAAPTEQRDDDHVAIVCLTTSDGSQISASSRRTYFVHFEVVAK